MNRYASTVLISVLAAAVCGQEVEIVSFHKDGKLTWTNANTGVVCHVEWASSLEGTWSRTWTNLVGIVITNSTTTVEVPMFYRVVCTTGVPTVENASFELPNVPESFSCTDPTGWTPTGGDCIQGINDEMSGLFATPYGEQVAYVNTGTTLSQTLTDLLMAGRQYTLTVAVGTRSDIGGGYDIRLKAGGEILSSTNGTLAAGTPFHDVTVVYEAPSGHPQLGQPLTIELTGTTQPQYDNVRLVAQSLE